MTDANGVSAWRTAISRVRRANVLHPLRQRRRARAQVEARAYFEARRELLDAIAPSISTGAGLNDYWFLHRYVRTRRPRHLLEFGSGKTTIVMAHALAENARESGAPAGHLVSLEDIPRFAENIREIFPEALRSYVTLVYSAKRETRWRGEIYGFQYAELPPGRFDFVFVDGPSGDEEAERRGQQAVSLDLLLLLARDPENRLDVVVDHRYHSLVAFQSVLPRGRVRFDPVMLLGTVIGASGRELRPRRPALVAHGSAWRLTGVPKRAAGTPPRR